MDWVRLEMRHYPSQPFSLVSLSRFTCIGHDNKRTNVPPAVSLVPGRAAPSLTLSVHGPSFALNLAVKNIGIRQAEEDHQAAQHENHH